MVIYSSIIVNGQLNWDIQMRKDGLLNWDGGSISFFFFFEKWTCFKCDNFKRSMFERSHILPILRRIKGLKAFFVVFHILYVYRETNRAVDFLSTFFPSSSHLKIIRNSFAMVLNNNVFDDRISRTYKRM